MYRERINVTRKDDRRYDSLLLKTDGVPEVFTDVRPRFGRHVIGMSFRTKVNGSQMERGSYYD